MRKNEIVRLVIEEINNLGCGVAHLTDAEGGRGQVVFVRDAVTGDELDARIIKVNKNYLVARIERLISPSPLRCQPDCTATGCGGCVYRHVKYEHELELKRAYVQNAFRKAGLGDVKVAPVRHTGELCGYRNKAQYPVRNGKNSIEVGFFATGTHRIVAAGDCKLQPPVFGELTAYVCRFCEKKRISAYDEESGSGLLRHVYLRCGAATGEIMVCLVLNGETMPREQELAAGLLAEFPNVKSVLLNVNTESTNVVLGERYRLIGGRDYIEDELCGLRFRISAGAFYQVNHNACELLYGIAKEKAGLTGKETLLDLYCGIGTIGLSMADAAGEIIGIEIVDEAVERAKENAERNGIRHASFYCGDASDACKLLRNAEAARGVLDPQNTVVVFDPPRKGSTEELITYISERQLNRVVYVSCNPDTLARDCVLFKKLGYQIGTVIPVDMFPRTGHVETVCLLSKLNAKQHIEINLDMDELDLTDAEKKATYQEIKDYVLEHTGLKVSSLYIAQVKQKCGIIERENYNKPKSEDAK
ncbi:MAG: 23S rRNA (uracil(1939)-C(5))-methyltransferase RlmD, partial [Clostridia bacterium]|nr:23S rRNA (uracil(1939)-C(5))-methyltransferase RlmD [Clostridia bacterium]